MGGHTLARSLARTHAFMYARTHMQTGRYNHVVRSDGPLGQVSLAKMLAVRAEALAAIPGTSAAISKMVILIHIVQT